jgi:O-acetyl-ADP-ribose deacetylase (regulator of RNase III)
MAVTYHEETDLFVLPADGFCHGCNTKGVIGGLASDVFSRLPDMKTVYKMACLQGTFEGGDIFPCDFETFWVYNLFTQEEPGANAELGFVRGALISMRDHMKANGVRLMNMPQVGCGIGGLVWGDVKLVVEDVFGGDDAVILQVVTRTTFG